MKLTYILPTCEPDSMFKFLLPTIYLLKPIKHLLEFNICFQPPYTKNDIKKVLDEFKKCHIKVNYMFKDYKVVKPYTPLIKMRNDCAMMSPNSDIYGLIDDDMSFEDKSICGYIRDMINRFETESSLAAISFYNQPEMNYRENFYSTNAGLFYRGGKYYGFKGLLPKYITEFNKKVNLKVPYNNENLLRLFGGHQDKFCAMTRLATGDYGDCIINVPVNHLENRIARGDKAHGWKDAEILEGSIASFIVKYFNSRFMETHALTLFDKEEDELIYPYKYENHILKEEYDLYDDRGIIKDWFSSFNINWKDKRFINKYNYLENIGLLVELPKDLQELLANKVNEIYSKE